MATSTNYGWAEPDNSSLVKNGASDIRTLGNAIDASVWSVGFGQAGKNKIINGDCAINQRNFSSGTATGQYIVDRFQDDGTGGTITSSVQQFTAGAAPVAGYEAKQFMRTITATQSAAGHYDAFAQAIEDVRTFAGQTVTVSFYAKAATGTPNIGAALRQDFGSGGSSAVNTSVAVKTITTSWARYSFTITMPSISGKTIGTSSFVKCYIFVSAGTTISGLGYPAVGLQNNTFDIWGIQVEAGSFATPFQTASGGSPQAELAMCQRYLPAFNSNSTGSNISGGYYSNTTNFRGIYAYQVQPRVAPTGITISNTAHFSATDGAADYVGTNLTFSAASLQSATINLAISGATIGRSGLLFSNNTSGQILFTGCEL
jgi:hypothetical protein